jgi:hypothetical protein
MSQVNKINFKDKSIKGLHETAMRLVGGIMLNSNEKHLTGTIGVFKIALKLETAAADKVPKSKESEPSRSILYRSAATIAMRCEEFGEALRLADEGLGGFPPPEIKKELAGVKRLAVSKLKMLEGSK